jgi:hypothetical protein
MTVIYFLLLMAGRGFGYNLTGRPPSMCASAPVRLSTHKNAFQNKKKKYFG